MKVNITYSKKRDPWQVVDIIIDEEDTWNLDSTLAEIIVPALKQLRDTTNGFPSDLYEAHGDDGAKVWEDILNKMIYSFEEAKDGYHRIMDKREEYGEDTRTWVEDHAEYMKKVQEGFDLFGKYYMALWD